MNYYFQLQYTLLQRQLRDFGLPPALGQVLAVVAFVAVSLLLFHKTALAQYLYVLVALSFVAKLSGQGRNEFLRTCFPKAGYPKVRLAENLLVTLPFLAVLFLKTCLVAAFVLLLLAVALSFFTFGKGAGNALPTPFGKRPFEFVVGFRRTFWLLLGAYALVPVAIAVDNFNLGIFSMLAVFATCLTYYAESEPLLYVWVHALSPRAFLRSKLKDALQHASLLTLPIGAVLCLFFPQFAHLLLAFQCLGYVYLATFVLAKYAAFPGAISLPQSILLGLCFVLPPMLLLVLPMFWKQALKRLPLIL